MPLNKAFQRRIEVLDACLRRRQRVWTIESLLHEVNEKLEGIGAKKIAKRSLYNDLDHLIYDLDAPIEKYRDNRKICYRYSNPDFSIRNLPLQQEEVAYLNDALDILRQVKGFQLTQELETVIGKLENTIATNVEKRHAIIQFEHTGLTSGSNWLGDIFQAVKSQVVLNICYQPFFKKASDIIFHPYLLKEYRNRWFVIGRVGDRNEPTILALDRIQKIKPTAMHFLANDLFDPETYYDSVVGVSLNKNGIPESVKLHIHRDLAPYVLTKAIHPSQKLVKTNANGDITLELYVVNNYELRSHLLGLGPRLKVILPESLREDLKQLYSTGMELYSK